MIRNTEQSNNDRNKNGNTRQLVKWDDAINDQNILVPENLTWNSEAPVNPDENGFYKVAVPGK